MGTNASGPSSCGIGVTSLHSGRFEYGTFWDFSSMILIRLCRFLFSGFEGKRYGCQKQMLSE
jgi:hypothetical protein